jgi:Right handed beta helix region/Dockerin type I domain
MYRIIFLILLLSFPQICLAGTINVHVGEMTIQEGIDSAVNGDTVLVHPGTYIENINFNGTSIALVSLDGPDVTIINAATDTIPIITLESGEDTLTLISGFKLRNCDKGGIYISPTSSATIENNIIKFCLGNAITCGSSSKILSNNIYSNMSYTNSDSVSAVYLPHVTNVTISDNNISNNESSYGCAINMVGGSGHIISYNVIAHNSHYYAGGSIRATDNTSDVTVINNTITQNWTPTGLGGGITLIDASSWIIKNNIISFSELSYGVYVESSTSIVFEYNNVYGNELGNYYGITPGTGCISEDPLFCNVPIYDYSLYKNSPCLGTGENGANMGALGLGCGHKSWNVYVDGSGDAPTIQAAIDSCVDYDSVLIHPGTYTGVGNHNISTDGKAILVKGVFGPDSTIIDCEGNYGFDLYETYEDSTTVIMNLAIMNGQSGIKLFDANPQLVNLILTNNTENGIDFRSVKESKSSIPITIVNGCAISNNGINGISGTHSFAGILWMEDCRIDSNLSNGIDFNNNFFELKRCQFLNNDVGISCTGFGSYGSLDSCLMDGNRIGMYQTEVSLTTITNCEIKNGETALYSAGYLYLYQVENSIIEGHTGTVIYGSADILNSTIRNNPGNIIADVYGMADDQGTLILKDSYVYNNGGSIISNDGFLDIKNTRIYNNSGGMVLSGGRSIIKMTASTYDRNSEPISANMFADMTLVNCTFANNINDAFQINNSEYSHKYFKNCIIAFNDGAGINVLTGTPDYISVSCCDVYENTSGNYVGIPDQTGLNSNISEDPLFCDTTSGEYYISHYSPCAPHNNSCDTLMGAFPAGCIGSNVWNVYVDGSGDAPTIQAAIDSASDGETVLIWPGTYSGTGNNDLRIKGKAITIKGALGPDTTIIDCEGYRGFYMGTTGEDSNTVIEGLSLTNAANAMIVNHVFPKLINLKFFNNTGNGIGEMEKTEPTAAEKQLYQRMLIKDCSFINNGYNGIDLWWSDGIEIINCLFEGNGDAGVRMDYDGGDIIRNSVFKNNGGGIIGEQSFGIDVDSCTFIDNGTHTWGSVNVTNSTFQGGSRAFAGVSVRAIEYSAENCTFHGITGTVFGESEGGIITNCEIVNNPGRIAYGFDDEYDVIFHFDDCTIINNGGGIYASGGGQVELSMTNCIYAHNAGTIVYGGPFGYMLLDQTTITNNPDTAIYIDWRAHSSVNFSNTIIANNIGFGITVNDQATSTFSITCCDFYNNTDGNFDGMPDQTGINGNISEDPLFCDTASGDYSIYASSPCAPPNNSCNVFMGAFDVGCGIDCGNVNGDGEIEVSDAVFLINYLFVGGPEPYPYLAGDVNCDDKINLVDVIFIVNYVFRGGNSPCDINGDGVTDC